MPGQKKQAKAAERMPTAEEMLTDAHDQLEDLYKYFQAIHRQLAGFILVADYISDNARDLMSPGDWKHERRRLKKRRKRLSI